jgi:hypothetical protein
MLVIAGVSGAVSLSCNVLPGMQGRALCATCQNPNGFSDVNPISEVRS